MAVTGTVACQYLCSTIQLQQTKAWRHTYGIGVCTPQQSNYLAVMTDMTTGKYWMLDQLVNR